MKDKSVISKMWKKTRAVFFTKRYDYKVLNEEDYLKQFGIIANSEGKYEVVNEKLLENAYQRSWTNRDFEIEKFWTRAAYFWGFIVLIFGGYITVLTSEHNTKALEFRLDLYLIVLGFVFSIAWYLVILGSKSWQLNWEAHIDNLENFVSGPLYKTIFYSKRFYSVSKINELMALLVMFVWLCLFIQYYSTNFSFSTERDEIDIPGTLCVIITIGFSLSLRYGYALGIYRTEKPGFVDRWS